MIQNLLEASIENPKNLTPRPTTIQQQERQIKYLGLVIEKDEEYVLQEDDLEMMYHELNDGTISRFFAKELEGYNNPTLDDTKRQYFPIRDKYIKIVKNSRKIGIEAFEKRGRKDLKQTSK